MLDSLLSPADLSMGARLVAGLPRVLRHPIPIEAARTTLRRRLERREADFLDLVRWGVYENPGSPYHSLLRLAGCELGDLQRLVAQEGLEGALRRLYAHGVYLTVDELKGRRAAIRGPTAIEVDPARLLSPRLAPHLLSQTSGSRGAPSLIPISLPAVVDRAVDLALIYQLVEEEGEEGQPRLRLLVHPRIGAVDAEALAETFLSAIGGTGSEHVMALFWREARLLRVEQRPPLAAPSGKIQHLHVGNRRPRP